MVEPMYKFCFLLIIINLITISCSTQKDNNNTMAGTKSSHEKFKGADSSRLTFSPFKFLKDSEVEAIYRSFGKLRMRTKILEDEIFELKNRIEELELKIGKTPGNLKKISKLKPLNSERLAEQNAAFVLFRKAKKLENSGNIDKAIPMYKRYLERYSKGEFAEEVNINLAKALYTTKKYNEVILITTDFEKRFPKSSLQATVLLFRGMAYRQLKQPKQAREHLSEIIKAHASSEEALKAKEELERLEDGF